MFKSKPPELTLRRFFCPRTSLASLDQTMSILVAQVPSVPVPSAEHVSPLRVTRSFLATTSSEPGAGDSGGPECLSIWSLKLFTQTQQTVDKKKPI